MMLLFGRCRGTVQCFEATCRPISLQDFRHRRRRTQEQGVYLKIIYLLLLSHLPQTVPDRILVW